MRWTRSRNWHCSTIPAISRSPFSLQAADASPTVPAGFRSSANQAMLASLEGKLKTGDIVRSRSIRAYLGESQIADALAAIQAAHAEVDIGSYPFYRDDRYGTVLVLRGTSLEALDTVAGAVMDAVTAAGETPEDLGEG